MVFRHSHVGSPQAKTTGNGFVAARDGAFRHALASTITPTLLFLFNNITYLWACPDRKEPRSLHIPPGAAVLTGRFEVVFRVDSVEEGDDEDQAAGEEREEDPKCP